MTSVRKWSTIFQTGSNDLPAFPNGEKWLLLALIAAGILLIFIHIPSVYTAWSLIGLAVFGLYTVLDFNPWLVHHERF